MVLGIDEAGLRRSRLSVVDYGLHEDRKNEV